jgi:hypothetical protein
MKFRALFVRGRWPAAGLLAVACFLGLVARFWHPVYGFTVFYQLDAPNDDLKIAAFRTLPVYVHRDTGGYDGLYYAQLAHDPTLRDPQLPRAMDDFPYRARRILAPALAWLAGLGQPAWIVPAYAALNLAVWLILAAVLWRLLAVDSARAWFAWAGVLFAAGTLGSVRLALTDNLALLLIAASGLAAERARERTATGLLAAAALARETALFAAAALVRPPWFSRRNVLGVLFATLPLALWLVYVRLQVGAGNPGWGNFAFPGRGLLEKFQAAVAALATVADRPLAWTTLLATLAVTVQAAFVLLHRDFADRWWRLGAVFTGLMLLLGTAVWEGFPGAFTRVLLPLQLAFNVRVVRTRASFLWLLAGNLSLFSGLLALRDVPREANELTAQRLGATVAVVRFDTGWFGREQDRGRVWLWTERRGALVLETMPPAARALRLHFALRSLAPREVSLYLGDRELWRGGIGPARSTHVVTLPAGLPRLARLQWSTADPPVPEGPQPGARALGFALYDVRLE